MSQIQHDGVSGRVPFAIKVAAGGLSVLALALVIWIKLRVVTTVPRTAYADPESKQEHRDEPAAQK